MTIMLTEGLDAQKKFKETGKLTEPLRQGLSEDEYWLFMTINKAL